MASGSLVVDVANHTGTSYTATLSAGREYRWNVSACNAAGCSSYTTPMYFQTPGDPRLPMTPANPTPGATASPGPTLESGSVTLSWDASDGASQYTLHLRDVGSDALLLDLKALRSLAYTVDLPGGRHYEWRVSACNAAGCSSYTTPMYFQTPSDVVVPPVPSNPSPGSTSSPGPTLGSSTATFSWSASTGATSYSFGVRDMASGSLVVDVTNHTGTSYTATLSAGREYRWNVSACNAAGCSSYTTPVYFQTPAGESPPSAPVDLSPGSTSSPGPTLSSRTVTLSWSASTGATFYSFGVRDMASNSLVVDVANHTGTSYTATLSAGREYRWNVSACNAAGCSSYTTPMYFQTPSDLVVPPVPSNPSPGSTSSPGPTLSSRTVTLSWSASTGATFYSFGVRDMASGSLVVDVANHTGTSYTATLSAGREYRWNVSACNAAGCSSYTTPMYFQTPSDLVVPSLPSNPSPGSTSSPGPTLGSSTATFSWSASTGATSYSFGVRDMASGSLVVDVTNHTGTSYTATLSAGREYRWNVSACNAAGCSSYTTPMYFQTPSDLVVPSLPSNPSPGSTSSPGPTLSSRTVTLSWSASTGATFYSFGVRDMASNSLVVDVANHTGTSYTATLSAGREYRWNVSACNAAGCSSYTTPMYFQTPSDLVVPSLPSNPSPGSTSSPGPTLSSRTVTLSWSASTGATFYSFGVRDMASNSLVVDVANHTGTSYTATLSAGREYRWNVSACNAAGCSSYTTPMYFQTPSDLVVPPVPSNPSPGSTSSPGPTLSSRTVTLSWSASTGATFYSFGVRDMASGSLVVDVANHTGTSYTATLSAGREYRWNVSACNAAGCSSYTTPMYFQTPSDLVVPSLPSNPSPGSTSSPGPTLGSSTATFSWSASTGATSYSFGVRDMASGSLVVDVTNHTGTSYTATLSAGREYRWNVSACNAAGCSSYTTPMYFQTPGG
jgi:hypothetical protein